MAKRRKKKASWEALNWDGYYRALGARIRKRRHELGLTQEDMIGYEFSARHYQQIEAGRPVTLTTLVRVCRALKCSPASVLRGLDKELG